MIVCPGDRRLEQLYFINVQFVTLYSSMSKSEDAYDHCMGVETHAGLESADF